MDKTYAIQVLGPTEASVARKIGVTQAAICKWPATGELPSRISDRVEAAQWRELHRIPHPVRKKRGGAAQAGLEL